MADRLNSDGFLIETTEKKFTEETEEIQTEFSDFTNQDEDNLLSEEANETDEDIPSAQVQGQKPKSSDEPVFKKPKERPSTSSHQQPNERPSTSSHQQNG